jgi:predicted DNA-binding protein
MKKPKKTIACRLPDEVVRLLDAKAEELGVSQGICLRVIVTEYLLGQSYLMEELRETKEGQLRNDRNLKVATVAILVDAGKASVEEAEAFIREKFS